MAPSAAMLILHFQPRAASSQQSIYPQKESTQLNVEVFAEPFRREKLRSSKIEKRQGLASDPSIPSSTTQPDRRFEDALQLGCC
ncbi:hypothetical protein CDL15_Pgr028467 [Punica granatum]|uniref:Uncharacterized protein n=1 Tax=Punica granatum TaxID=22663 RepID=A0A218VXE8_PUNGR|nr:hypothetical protein CDL15_Pgr028467 [Punica granatum]